MSNILFLDIETAPNLAYVWRFFKENISPSQIIDNSSILCWAAKWLGDDEIFYEDAQNKTEKTLLKKMNKLLDKADMVVGHNGSGFDLPKIRGRSLVSGLTPPSPYKEIDTWRIARREFGFESNSLEYLSSIFGLTPKTSHGKFPGFKLWAEVLAGNPAAWEEMREYNIQDVLTLEELYLKLRAYDSRHPNVAVFDEPSDITCPKCGSEDNYRRGFYYTNVGKYQRYQCNSCGGWHRSRFTVMPKEVKQALTVNAV